MLVLVTTKDTKYTKDTKVKPSKAFVPIVSFV